MKRSVNPKEILLENILIFMQGEKFGKNLSARIVGGEQKLTELIAAGEIMAEKPTASQNGKWFCNAAQVLSHCRNMRE